MVTRHPYRAFVPSKAQTCSQHVVYVFNSHTLNPSGCGPKKTQSTLGKLLNKEVGIVEQQLKPLVQNLYKLNKDDEIKKHSDPQNLSVLCSFPCACQVVHYP